MKETVMARMRAALVGTTTLITVIWTIGAGSGVASASTRLRSGTLHAQLASHVSTGAGANTLSSGLALKGSAVIAAIVGVLAVCALAFLIVTFIRRRVTVA
jgi:CHASE2 domain-containing sensor protein